MLSPDKIAAMDAASGLTTAPQQDQGQALAQSRANEIRQLAQQAQTAQENRFGPLGTPIVKTAKAGVENIKSGISDLFNPQTNLQDVQDLRDATKGGGIGAGILQAGATGLKAGEKGVAGLGKIVGGIAQTALSPILGPVSAVGTAIGEKIGNAVPTDAAMKFANMLQAHPEIGKNTTDIMNMANLAFPEVMEKAGPGLDAATTKVQGTAAKVRESLPETPHPIDALRGYADAKVKTGIESDVKGLLTATRAIGKKSSEAAKLNTDFQKILSDPQIFKGLKVENGKINPDEAISKIDERIQPLLDAKRDILPKIDSIVPTTPKTVILNKALDYIKGKSLPADEAKLAESIKEQIAALPDQLKPSEIDALRAKARLSARDAKGQMKSSNEYAAIENAARDTVFDITDKLPVQNAGEYKALNDYIKQMITTKDFLDNTIRNQVVKGGRLKGYSMKLLGSVAGASHGPLGALVGHGVGGVVADIVTNNQLGSSFKMSLIKNLTDDPAILAQAEKLLSDVKSVEQPQLPRGNPNTPVLNNGKPIQVGTNGPQEYVGSETRIGNYQSELGNNLRSSQ